MSAPGGVSEFDNTAPPQSGRRTTSDRAGRVCSIAVALLLILQAAPRAITLR